MVLKKLSRSLERLGPDGSCEVVSTPVGMLYRSFDTTAEAILSVQPLSGRGCIVTFDGRLDNREDLSRHLFSCADKAISDAALVLEAYRIWDAAFVGHLLGDFALALWDGHHQRLILARDPFGIRPLHYIRRGNELIWSSTTDSLVGLLDSVIVDKRFLAGYLWFLTDETHSPFVGITPVVPGHYLVFERGTLLSVRYWSIEEELGTIRYPKDEAYEEHFLWILKTVVGARLRSKDSVIAELSGGLDSSTIVSIAGLLYGSAARDHLKTLSFVAPKHAGTDETPYIETVEALVQTEHYHIERNTTNMLSRPGDPGFTAYPSQHLCSPGLAEVLFGVFGSAGSRVVLSGEGGDNAYCGDETMALYDPSLKRIALLRGILAWSEAQGSNAWDLWWNWAIRLNRRTGGVPQAPLPQWLSPQFLSESGLHEHRQMLNRCLSGVSDGFTARRCWNALLPRFILAGGCQHYYTSTGCIEARYPFLDRRLLRFVLSIPPDQLWRAGETRSILRRTMRGILPETVRTRRTKGSGDDVLMASLQRNRRWIDQIIDTSLAVESGYVLKEPLVKSVTRLRFGLDGGWLQFLRFVSTELWLRNVCECAPLTA
ncbi:MAG TPA: asparagine synthase-related protein [Bryobacteraceae bacterium]|nr:asparagine synthase-related protein [Bryobacteraceae bacterium]